MDLHRHLRSLALLIFILATYFSTVLARHQHPVRHRHNRHKRQHAHNSQYLPGSFVIDGNPNVPEAGNWGPWSEPSECSRSCGGGVAFQTRRCRDLSDTGEELCQGGTKRYFSCNIQDCPEASADFRAEQCAEFNAVPLEGRYYKWVPYTKAPNKCELNCMPKGDRFYYRHKRKVIDGTRCDEEKLDICVDGQCMPVGCDMMLGSTAREDNCRECGGDGSSCTTVVDTLEMDDLQVGYNDILLIPAGATNIQVREIKASNNYLAIRNVTGHYYLNGNWRIDFPRSLKFAGTIFHYERKPHGFFAPESLSALGPTTEPIYIVLLYQETNPGVHYEYSIPKGVAQQTDPDSYSWITDEFSECSATCGGGYQTRRVQCARRKDLQVVADYLCDLSLQPQSNQTCSTDPCPPQWFVGDWGPCSETCGEGGIQVRQVYCEQIVSGGLPSVVDDSLCIDILAHKPPTTQKCSEDVPCPTWHVGPWKPCNRLCGEGQQKRNVRCFRRVEGKIEVLGDSACPGEKPEDEKPCEVRPCEGVDWVVSDWSGCEDKCGLTQETRRVHCANQAGKLYPDEYCHKYRLPELTRSCESPIPCEHEWFASQWSECSAHCGVGVKTRKVFCGEEVGDTVKKVPDEKCDLRKKYEAESNCTGEEECAGQWYTGPWSACTVPCGGGRMTRKVLCYVENATVDIKNCDPSLIHFSSETCNNSPCTEDQIMPMEPSKAVTEEDEEEECEDDIEGSLITMETTLGLGVTPIAGGTEKQEIDFEGSGGVDFDKLEFEEGTSESPSSDVSVEATDGMLLSTASDALLGTASPSEILSSSSSVSEGVTDLTDLMLSDSAGTSIDSTYTTGSGDEESSEDAKSTDVTSSDDTKATDFTSSEDTASTDVSSKLSSLSTDGESSSSIGSESSGSTVEGTSSSVDFTSSSLESSSISPTVDSSGATESSVSSESSSGSSVQSSSSDSSPSSVSTEPSVSMSSELTSEEGSGMTGTTDLETDVTSLTGTGIPFEGEVEEGSGETTTSIEESSTAQTHISSTSATDSSSISVTEISSTSATEISSSSETSSTVEAESSQTEVSETVESSSVFTSESSPDVSGTSESGASTDGSSTITVLTTESSVLTSESPLSTAESPVTEPTSETESTVSPLSTESDEYTTGSTEEYTSTEVSGESSAEVEEEIKKTTLTPAEIAITKEQKVKKCKRKKKKPKKEPVKCETTEFGCCPDGKTVAQGPFSKGCAQPETCQETEFGCCPDGVSPAEGKKFKGCPPSFCSETLFGCCPDGVRIAEGNDLEGCEEIVLECNDTDFGCCPDGHTAATGPNNAGCFECEGSGECDTCKATKFGCCSDGVRAADGPDGEGCEDILVTEEPEEPVDCSNSTHGCCPDGIKVATGPYFEGCGVIDKENCSASYFGCCPDGESPATGPRYAGCRMPCEDEPFGCCNDTITPAHGPNQAGCCLTTPYGCCPDNIRPAQGPQLEGCGCQYSTYGCCPDNSTVARGPNAEGCGCQYTKYGCCPNRYTPAAGPEYQGCPCYTYQFGCCPDGVNIAKGPFNQGCGCENTEFGCCPDDRTPSPDANKEGCGCEASKFGCCPDGSIEAQGDKFEGCKEIPVLPGEACTQEKDRGTCRDFKVKWFFDMEYGGCSRFWYGGCDGNDNRFASQEECKERCVEPPGRDACYLPKIEGPCEGYYPHWYYDAERKQCGQFIYGGCLGNNNRFETREECDELCVVPDTLDVCEQPKMKGPCRGNFSRWYYDQDLRMCQEFPYGGCHGNRNNFLTEIECQHQCLQPGRSRDYCALPRDEGNCTERHPRWFFDASENRCMPFYYSGCGGNDNRFHTQDICEADCPARIEQDLCLLPAAAGECHNYSERWYYDSYHVRCTPFYYGGCGGNQNNFLTMEACQRRCESGYNTPEPPQQFKQEWCFLRDDHGPCSDSMAKWYYDSRDGVCKQFLYGGCQGNQNKFTTREECEQYCGHVQDACDLPRVVGPCSGSIAQWYYDRSTDSCYEFDYGGCQGNANRFNDRQQCEEHCKVLISTAPAFVPSALTITTQSPFVAPEPSRDICAMSVDTGPCDSEIAAWYYNKTSSECHAFIYGGCGGNANRFESEEQCERQCGNFKGQDVCNLPADIGPCRGNFRKWFYNPTSGECEEFGFGGCQGNGNRFSSLRECEHICLHRNEPQPKGNDTTLSNQAICRLPVETGPCSVGYFKRWYYDDDRQTCIPFIYSGCAGNRNRFKNFQSCLKFCAPEGMNVIDVESPPEKPEEDPCQNARLECNTLRCPYGVEKYLDSTYCERCQCHDPCKDQVCPGGTQCAVDLFRNPRTGSTEFRAACRSTNKPGKCPRFEVDDENCVNECQTDADCTGDNKCCFSGCVSSCLSPLFDALTTEAPRTHHEPQAVPPRFEDRDVDPRIQAQEGTYCTLPCTAIGNPTPTITWRRGAVMIDNSGRYKLLLNGSLQIIGLYRKDTGVYVCLADNGVGQPIQREYHLEVTEPTAHPAEVIGEDRTYVVVTLGAPTILQCYAVGWPPPTVTWWRGDRMLPFSSEQYEQRRDYSLLIRSVTLRNLGHYTCQAYNGYGRAASWTVTVQAVGPVYSSSPGDSVYNEFLIPSPKRPEAAPEPVPTRPSYPFRPVRPPGQYRPRPSPTPPPYRPPPPPPPEPTEAPQVPPEPYVPEREVEEPSRGFTVPVQTTISLTRTVYPIGSDISIPCDVDGYPIPHVVWYKDEELLEPNERIQITENHRLRIVRANGSDAGSYKCSASNQYGSHSSSVSIAVEGIYIHPNCTDNPFFANCKLIVEGRYCTHKYYARFCCKSCTQAGQLPSDGPHLDKSGTLSNSRRK